MIADYAFYTDVYYGDVLTEDNFPKYAARADSYLESLTLGRYADDSLSASVITAVKLAECEVAEQCLLADEAATREFAAAAGDGVYASESVGAHSVTYRSGAELAAQAEARIRGIVTRRLGRFGLLYRGVSCVHATHSYTC